MRRNPRVLAFSCLVALLGLVASAAAVDSPSSDARITLSGKQLDSVPREVLLEVLAHAGISSAQVVAVGRTTQRQASVMYEFCRANGVEAAREKYSRHAEKIIDVYEANASRPRDVAIERMATEIERVVAELGPDRTTMRLVYSDRHVFDVRLSDDEDRQRFQAAAASHPDVLRVLPPEEKMRDQFHVQVSSDAVVLGGSWSGVCRSASDPARAVKSGMRVRSGQGFWVDFEQGGSRRGTANVVVDKRRRQVQFRIGETEYSGVFDAPGKRMLLSTGTDSLCLLER